MYLFSQQPILELEAFKHLPRKVDDLCLLDNPIKTLHKGSVCRILSHIIISVLGAGKLNDKCMSDAILRILAPSSPSSNFVRLLT